MSEINGQLAGLPGDFKLLQALVVENPDLERLESLLDQFNIFEALGVVKQELRHSDFLAFLLNPRQPHGLGDTFVKRLLQKSLALSRRPQSINAIDLDIWDLDDVEVRREWANVDILIVDEAHRLVVVIENKVFTGEHSGQLQKYSQLVSQHFPGYRALNLFLTPVGDEPSDSDYIAISYDLICRLIEEMVVARSSTLGHEVLTVLRHYTQMLRRHIVNESEIAELCQKIYRKHQRALDLIYEYRPDQQAYLRDFLETLIRQTPGFILDHLTKSRIRFLPKAWDISALKGGQGWTPTGRMLLFEFTNSANVLKLGLHIGPGSLEIRQRLFQMAATHIPPFKPASKALYEKWNNIYTRTVLPSSVYVEKTQEELEEEIRKKWDHFLANDLQEMMEVLAAEPWLSS